jgi:hypothetical protein
MQRAELVPDRKKYCVILTPNSRFSSVVKKNFSGSSSQPAQMEAQHLELSLVQLVHGLIN